MKKGVPHAPPKNFKTGRAPKKSNDHCFCDMCSARFEAPDGSRNPCSKAPHFAPKRSIFSFIEMLWEGFPISRPHIHRAFFPKMLPGAHSVRLPTAHAAQTKNDGEGLLVFSLIQSFWEGYGEALFTEKGSPYRVPASIEHFSQKCCREPIPSVCRLPTQHKPKTMERGSLCFPLFKAFGRDTGKPFSPKRVPHIASPASIEHFSQKCLPGVHSVRLPTANAVQTKNHGEELLVFSLIQSFWEGYGEALFTEKGSPYRVPRKKIPLLL